jgi:hypothetical protein
MSEAYLLESVLATTTVRFDPQITQITQIFFGRNARLERSSFMDFERAKRVRYLNAVRNPYLEQLEKNLCNLCNLWFPSLKAEATQ